MDPSSQNRSLGIDYQTLTEMPTGELARLAEQLGLKPPPDSGREEMLDIIRRRLELIDRLDRQALLDVVVWAHRPVRKNADKLELVREIAQIGPADYGRLSHAGLHALATLRGLDVQGDTPPERIVQLLHRHEGLAGFWERKRRRLIGWVVNKLIQPDNEREDYRFLPDHPQTPTLKDRIEKQGVVGGVLGTAREVADQYVNAKLDEIEQRIDRKLDQIDQRLAQWRDQEVANRLRIIKITLIASIIVATISLGYSYVKNRYLSAGDAASQKVESVQNE